MMCDASSQGFASSKPMGGSEGPALGDPETAFSRRLHPSYYPPGLVKVGPHNFDVLQTDSSKCVLALHVLAMTFAVPMLRAVVFADDSQ